MSTVCGIVHQARRTQAHCPCMVLTLIMDSLLNQALLQSWLYKK